MDILANYLQRSKELLEQRKTGRECLYCGEMGVTTNSYGAFCGSCGSPRRRELGQVYGIPIYDVGDWIELLGNEQIRAYQQYPVRSRE